MNWSDDRLEAMLWPYSKKLSVSLFNWLLINLFHFVTCIANSVCL